MASSKAMGPMKRTGNGGVAQKKPAGSSSKVKITVIASTPGRPAEYDIKPGGISGAPKITMTRPAVKGSISSNDPEINKKLKEMVKKGPGKPEILVKRPTPSANIAGSATPKFRRTTGDNRNVNSLYGNIGGKFR